MRSRRPCERRRNPPEQPWRSRAFDADPHSSIVASGEPVGIHCRFDTEAGQFVVIQEQWFVSFAFDAAENLAAMYVQVNVVAL